MNASQLIAQAKDLDIKFWTKVNKTDTCWLWTGRLNKPAPMGYGRLSIKGNEIIAHHVSYILAKGDIPEGKEIDHLCRVRQCVRPDHLEAVTGKENKRRGFSPLAINSRKTHCPRKHPLSGENLYVDKLGRRCCRACANKNSRDWYYRTGTYASKLRTP